MGYDHLWTYDHLSWYRYHQRPWYSALTWLAGVAGVTSRVRIGTMVSSPNFHHPAVLAKQVMTIDHLSGGRFTLGLGAGGLGYDATVLGREPLEPSARVRRFREFVAVTDHLLRHPATTHHGQHYDVVDARMHPGCIQQPRVPLAIAAGGAHTLDITARYGDAWITYGDTAHRDVTVGGTVEIVRRQLDLLAEACARHGRDAGSLQRIYLIGNTQARPLASTAAFAEFAADYETLGFTDLVFHHPRPDDPIWNEPEQVVEDIAVSVLPTLQAERRDQWAPGSA